MTKVIRVDFEHLESKINEIGWSRILQIIPDHEFDTTLYVIVFIE